MVSNFRDSKKLRSKKPMERNEDIKQYLSNKHKGGKNNQKGSLFEDFYAVYQIILGIAKYKPSFESVNFQTQVENAFVDDLLITYLGHKIYHQLKNTQSLSWGQVDKKGDIAYDFAHQIEYCKECNETFTLKLVYSQKENKIGEHTPEVIKEYTVTEYFDYSPDLNSLVLISEPFKSALLAIVPDGDRVKIDELSNIASVFLGVWKGFDSNSRISLKEIVHRAEEIKQVNLNIYPDESMSENCKIVLNAIEGFEYYISGRSLYWSIGRMNGCCPWQYAIETEIIRRHPTDKWELISMLS